MALSEVSLIYIRADFITRRTNREPLVMAPAERWRATGGASDPSRCHGARVCFVLSSPIAFSSLDSHLICLLITQLGGSALHLLVRKLVAVPNDSHREAWVQYGGSVGSKFFRGESCRFGQKGGLLGVSSTRAERDVRKHCRCISTLSRRDESDAEEPKTSPRRCKMRN